jgi:hypothetical protein
MCKVYEVGTTPTRALKNLFASRQWLLAEQSWGSIPPSINFQPEGFRTEFDWSIVLSVLSADGESTRSLSVKGVETCYGVAITEVRLK